MLFVLTASAVIITGLLMRSLFAVRIRIAPTQADVFLRIRIFFRIVKITFHIRLCAKRGEKLRIASVKKNGAEKLLFPNEKTESRFSANLKKIIKDSGISYFTKLKKAVLRARVGTESPDVCVYSCSALKTVADAVFLYAFPNDTDNMSISVYPDFERCSFILNLECITSVSSVKIILAIAKALFMREKNAKSLNLKGELP